MGRPAKPASEKAMTGASRRARRKEEPIVVLASTLKPPTWMTKREWKAVWHRIVPELQRFNTLNDSFRDTLARYCVHFAEWIKLTKSIERQGTTMMVKMTNSDEKMPRLNPAIRVRAVIEKDMLDLEDRFGISPLARYRIIAQQAAHPAGRDLFGNPAKPDSENPVAPKASPIGMLGGQVLN